MTKKIKKTVIIGETAVHMDQHRQLERLQRITDPEWKTAIKVLGAYIIRQIYGKTKFGAHSESVLGMPPVEYYTGAVIEALFSGKWEWKDDTTLADQLKSIAWSKISAQVQNYVKRKDVLSTADLSEALSLQAEDSESAEMYEICQDAAKGDEELERYVQAVHDNNSFKDICSQLGIEDKKLVYNLQRKLKRRIKSMKR